MNKPRITRSLRSALPWTSAIAAVALSAGSVIAAPLPVEKISCVVGDVQIEVVSRSGESYCQMTVAGFEQRRTLWGLDENGDREIVVSGTWMDDGFSLFSSRIGLAYFDYQGNFLTGKASLAGVSTNDSLMWRSLWLSFVSDANP